MDVAIAGSTGLLGTALARSLRADGHRVLRLVRGEPPFPGSELAIRWDPVRGTIDGSERLAEVGAVVNLAGRGIGTSRWTRTERQRVWDSRILSTRLLAETLAGLDHAPPVFVSASAIGFYGDRGDEVLDETSGPGEGFLAELCRAWEAAAAPAEAAGVRVAKLRTGLVLSGDGGLLDRPKKLFALGLGGRLGHGDQWWSWISIDDEIGAIRHVLAHDVSGAVNLTAPHPVTNAEFTRTLGRVLGRPAILPLPRFAARLALGRDLADEVVLAGQRVLPRALENSGYSFRHTDVESALRAVLHRPLERA